MFYNFKIIGYINILGYKWHVPINPEIYSTKLYPIENERIDPHLPKFLHRFVRYEWSNNDEQ